MQNSPAPTYTPASAHARRAHYDLATLRSQLEEQLEALSGFLQQERVQKALGKELLRELKRREQEIRARFESEFTLVVLGEFKRGKSSLINALLQARIVTTNITPETVTINEIHFGPETKLQICLSDGGRVELASEELSAAKLEPILKELAAPVSYVHVQAPVEWLRGIRLVDTPGMGDLLRKFDRQVVDYLPTADALIYVTTSDAPFSEQERDFLRVTIMPQDFPRILFVVNKLDIATTPEDVERVLAHAREKLASLFPESSLLGISALDEIARLEGRARPNAAHAEQLAARFEELRTQLYDIIVLNRHVIQMDRVGDLLVESLRLLQTRVNRMREALQADQTQKEQTRGVLEGKSTALAERIEQHRTQTRARIEAYADQVTVWMDGFADRLEQEAIHKLNQYRFEDVQRYFQFFLADSFRAAINQCIGANQAQVIQIASEARRAVAQDIRELARLNPTSTFVAPVVAAPSFSSLQATSLELFESKLSTALFAGFSDPLLSALIAFATNRFLERTQEKKQIATYQQKLLQAFPELRRTVKERIKTLYQNMAEQVDKQLQQQYTQDLDELRETLAQEQEIRQAGAPSIAAANQVFQEIDEMIQETLASLDAFRKKLSLEKVLET